MYVKLVMLDLRVAGTQRSNQAPPIGISTGKGTFPDRRVGYRSCRDACLGVAWTAADVDDHQLGGAFSVAGHLTGEIASDVTKRDSKCVGTGQALLKQLISCQTIRQDNGRVIGRHISVDTDHIERVVHSVTHGLL